MSGRIQTYAQLEKQLAESQQREAELQKSEHAYARAFIAEVRYAKKCDELRWAAEQERDRLRTEIQWAVDNGYRHYGKTVIHRLKRSLKP